jgi:hypothetical protein
LPKDNQEDWNFINIGQTIDSIGMGASHAPYRWNSWNSSIFTVAVMSAENHWD